MGETSATYRAVEPDFGRGLSSDEAPDAHHDPLAELARLVDTVDPLASVFGRAPAASPAPSGAGAWEAEMARWEAEMLGASPQPPALPDATAHSLAPPHDHGFADEHDHAALHHDAHAAVAVEPFEEADAHAGWGDEPFAEPARRTSKSLYLMGGAVALVLVGVGSTLALRGGARAPGDAPTILAASGPTKIQPEGGEPAVAQTATVLGRQADKLGPTRLVNTEEQPIDVLSQARVSRAAPGPRPGSSQTPTENVFPEPRKVRTFAVRPDGSIVNADTPVGAIPTVAPPPAPAPAPRPSVVASATTTPPAASASPPVSSIPAPKTASPAKTTARVATLTRPDDANGDATPAQRPRPAPVAAPIVAPAASSAGGGFAVQLAAAGSEAEAKQKIAAVRGKLDGRSPVVIKADANGKTVYRVRVGGLAKADASALCSKLKESGDACFVAAN